MKDFIHECWVLFSYPKNLVLLAIRLLVAFGFANPVVAKMHNITATTAWFKALAIPFATYFVYFIIVVEGIGVLFLLLGIFSRFAALLLIAVMVGAIIFIHAANGFSALSNGVEIPLLYIGLLLVILTHGAGKYSLEYLLFGEIDG